MSRGGYRSGAGRPTNKVRTRTTRSIDVRMFAKRGYLDHPQSFTWSWTRNGEPFGNISVKVEPKSHITLNYSATVNEQARTYADRVNLSFTPCNYGNSRPWFICPRCGNRMAILYMRNGNFACRHCQKVAYSSQSDSAIDRTWRIQRKIEARIGEKWQRPKGMRLSTYNSLTNTLFHCQSYRDHQIEIMAKRMFGDLQKMKFKTISVPKS